MKRFLEQIGNPKGAANPDTHYKFLMHIFDLILSDRRGAKPPG
jgi:hypothetical protein